ncbi:hypothetical protein C3L33_15276, partial [Rhododendron williamsianum]
FSISIFMAFSIPWFVQSVTLQSDIEALRSLINGIDPNLIPPSSFLNTWEFEADPCDSTGHISTLGAMPSLKTLDLSDNRFSGSITGEIVMLPNLNRINASLNSFSVVEVTQVPGGESQLQVLDVHGNTLSGQLPVNLVTYGNLTEVNLGSNQFSGQIPAEYGGKLGGEWRSLFLDHNYLVGTLPSEFTDGGGAYVRGSVAQNCLTRCPLNVRWCRGGQRSASRCNAQNGNTTVESNF